MQPNTLKACQAKYLPEKKKILQTANICKITVTRVTWVFQNQGSENAFEYKINLTTQFAPAFSF